MLLATCFLFVLGYAGGRTFWIWWELCWHEPFLEYEKTHIHAKGYNFWSFEPFTDIHGKDNISCDDEVSQVCQYISSLLVYVCSCSFQCLPLIITWCFGTSSVRYYQTGQLYLACVTVALYCRVAIFLCITYWSQRICLPLIITWCFGT